MNLSDNILEEFRRFEEKIEQYKSEGKRLFVTSSFQTHSIPLLHLISRIDREIPIYFTNTGFLFPETLAFKDQLAELFGLKIIPLYSAIPKTQQYDRDGHLIYTSDPDYCCHLNKVQPLEPILAEYDVWINGIRKDQSVVRKSMNEEEKAPFNTLRYHPMLHWNSKMIWEYRKAYQLPSHPLEEKGYLSVGCEPCTQKYLEGMDERSGRWAGLKKNECGLHTSLIKKNNT